MGLNSEITCHCSLIVHARDLSVLLAQGNNTVTVIDNNTLLSEGEREAGLELCIVLWVSLRALQRDNPMGSVSYCTLQWEKHMG